MEESVERGPRMGGMQLRNEPRLEKLHGKKFPHLSKYLLKKESDSGFKLGPLKTSLLSGPIVELCVKTCDF